MSTIRKRIETLERKVRPGQPKIERVVILCGDRNGGLRKLVDTRPDLANDFELIAKLNSTARQNRIR